MTSQALKAPAPGGSAQDIAGSTTRDLRFLTVVDGSERTNRVIDFMVAIAQGRDNVEAIVLNVQDRHYDGRLRGYQSFKRKEVEDRLLHDVGLPIVVGVSNRLHKAGIVCVSKVKIGEPALSILDCAAEDKCDVIVLANPQALYLRRWLRAMGLPLLSPLIGRIVTAACVPVVIVE